MARAKSLSISSVLTMLIAVTALGQSIPVDFTIPTSGKVTVVIDDLNGNRVQNLVQNTQFPAGANSINWDGRDVGFGDYAGNDWYTIVNKKVKPGTYNVRGIMHQGIADRYQFSVQSPGAPAWNSPDRTGGWLSDQTSADDIMFAPAANLDYTANNQMLVVSRVSEVGDGYVYLDENGLKTKSQASFNGLIKYHTASINQGPAKNSFYLAFHALRSAKKLKIAFTKSGAGAVQAQQYAPGLPISDIQGSTVWDTTFAVSYTQSDTLNGILFVDVDSARFTNYKTINDFILPDVRGITTDGTFMYALVGTELRRYDVSWTSGTLSNPTVLVTGLSDPKRVKLLSDGFLYVSDWGTSHQVKKYNTAGTLMLTFGVPGGPQQGIYNEAGMSRPVGVDLDSQGKLWVAERAFMPKRISRWDAATGAFDRAWYGPPKYGGGLVIDSTDQTKGYYTGHQTGTIEFDINWTTGENKPGRILLNREQTGFSLFKPPSNKGSRSPQRVRHSGGFTYLMTPAWSQSHASIFGEVGLWIVRGDSVAWIGQFGKGTTWSGVFNDPVRYPSIVSWYNANLGGRPEDYFFAWTDLNNDLDVSIDEFQFFNVGSNLNTKFFLDTDLNLHVSNGAMLPMAGLTGDGIPTYDGANLIPGGYLETGVAAQIIAGSGTLVNVYGPIDGYKGGKRIWRYHSTYPRRAKGQGTSTYEGELIETTRLIGAPRTPPAGDSGPIWGLNSEKGELYLFTLDGLFLETLMGDKRTEPLWEVPLGVINQGDPIGDLSPRDEHFWPYISKGDDGEIYLVAGKTHNSILKLDGWSDVNRMDWGTITLSAADLQLLTADITVYLGGAYAGAGLMRTNLLDGGHLPLAQPYSDPLFDGTPAEYDGSEVVTGFPAGTVDWVTVELRTGTAAGTKVDQTVGFVKSDGSVVGPDGTGVYFDQPSGNYYVVVRHRNHIPVMSAAAVDFTSGTGTHDFTTGQAQAFGTNSMTDLGDGSFGLIAGDASGNSQVQTDDKNDFWAPNVGGPAGYSPADFDLTSIINNDDKNTQWAPNSGAGSQVP